MKSITYSILALCLALCANAENSSLPLVGKINIDIQEEKLQNLTAFLLSHHMYIPDELLAYKFLVSHEVQTASYANFSKIFAKADVEISPWTLATMDALDISPLHTYRQFTFQILKQTNLTNAFKELDINGTEFDNSLERNEYTILKKIDFAKALKILNISQEEMYSFIKPIVLQGMYKLELEDFMALVPEKSRENLILQIFEILKLSPKTEPFIHVLNEYRKVLNRITAMGTAISKYNFVTVSDFMNNTLHNYLKLSLDTSNASYIGAEITPYKAGYINVTTTKLETPSDIKVAKNYDTKLSNCTYVNEDGRVTIKNITNNDGLISFDMMKENIHKFTPGAPLVCNGYLYGIAGNMTEKHLITFISFKNSDDPDSKSSAATFTTSFVMIICSSALIKFF